MMIETKGTKSGDTSQTGARTYAPKEPAKASGTPYYLALAVAAVAGYLKSLFHDPVRAASEVEGETQVQAAPPKLVVLASAEPVPDDARPEARITGSAAPVPQAEAPASEYDAPDFLRHRGFQFAKPDPHPNLNDFKASPVVPRPLNDNGGAAKAGGGGHGGGGGHDRASDKPSGDASSGDEAPHPMKPPVDASTPVDGPIQGAVVDTDAPRDPAGAPGGGSTSGAGPGDPGGDDALPPRDRTPTGSGEPDGRRNRAPVSSGPVHLADTTGCALLAIALNDLLRTVQDPDGDALSVRNLTVSSGVLTRDGDGWLFDGDAPGPVTITYEVTDGALSIAQTAIFEVVDRNAVTGSDGDDIILGTLCADAIDGGGGADIIDARAGSDIVDGGPGDDHIVGGDGDDTILGGAGDDVIFAGAGADVVSGGTGNDRIFGEDGDDILSGDAGDDLIDGGEGNDILLGSTGSDTLFGDAGNDRIDAGDGSDLVLGGVGRDVVSGGEGDDRLEGGEGDDLLSDGSGRDLVLGQDGDDVLAVSLDRDDDVFDGGAGQDTLDLSGTTSGVAVDLADGVAAGQEIGTDTVASVEVVVGGSGDDTFAGSAAADTLSGGSGLDRLSGGAGDDVLDGGEDADTLSDGTGSDIVRGGAGDDVVTVAADGEADRFEGGDGQDTLDLAATTAGVVVDLAAGTSVGAETGRDVVASIETVVGGSGADALTGSAGGDRLLGGAGRDALAGGAGDDVLDGGEDADTLSDGTGSDIVRGGAGDDVVTVAADGEADRFEGGDGQDTLDLSTTHTGVVVDLSAGTSVGAETGRDVVASIETVVGGSGADALTGSAGGDRLLGGAGRDALVGGAGDDVLDGGEDADTLSDGTGSDIVRGGAGDDVVTVAADGEADRFDGGTGEDTLDLAATTAGVVVDLAAGTSVGAETGRDVVASIETVVGGSGADALTGSAGGDRLLGGAGRDALGGGAGDDVLDGGDDADTLSDGTGSDIVRGGAGDDVVTVAADGEADRFEGGDGQDTLDLSTTHSGVTVDLVLQTLTSAETGQDLISGLEALVGGSGADALSGGTGADTLSGGAGDDRLDGRSGDDRLDGGSGRDTLRDGAGRDTLRGGDDDDRIVLAMDGENDEADGGEGSDTLDLGGATGDLLVDLVDHVVSGTELGKDQVDSVERIVAGSGNDRFVIGDEDVVLTGGGGKDGYAFLPRTGTQEATRSVEITDFSVGDYVDILRWTLFEEGSGIVGQSLSDAMDRDDGTVSGIRYRAAHLDGGDVTVISADLDRDDRFETTVVLDGHHTLLFVENATHPAVSTPATPIS
jgi:Ca2+-binding RTX toxin-like protein